MVRRLIVVTLTVAACSPAVTEGSTTTTVSGTSTTIAATTTSEATTTTGGPITTTSQPTTTTSPVTTTTQQEGNWADQPLVTTGFGALGWWDGDEWIVAEDEGALPVVGGEDYQVAKIDHEGIISGGPQTIVCEPVDNIGVVLDDPGVLGEWPGPYGVAISAPWDLQPHLFEAFDDDDSYAQFAKILLAERGLEVDAPLIKQLFRTDLEGDGVNEVLVVAERLTNGYLPAEGDYSIAFMRKVVQGEVQTAVFMETVITDPEGAWVVGFTFGAVADLNGDGKMEVVLDMADFEGLGVSVWEYVNDDLGPILVMQTGCGA